MSAAARAASVAPETAMPQSAFLSAGASFTPSPVMPTMWPRCWSASTMWNLCSGKTWAKPSACFDGLVESAGLVALASPRPAGVEDVGAQAELRAISWAMATWSPVTIFTSIPICLAVAMVALESSRGGSKSGSTPRNCQWPSPSVRATPSERKPRAANSSTAVSTARLDLRGVGGQRQDHLRRALGHLERVPVGAADRRPRCACGPGRTAGSEVTS